MVTLWEAIGQESPHLDPFDGPFLSLMWLILIQSTLGTLGIKIGRRAVLVRTECAPSVLISWKTANDGHLILGHTYRTSVTFEKRKLAHRSPNFCPCERHRAVYLRRLLVGQVSTI